MQEQDILRLAMDLCAQTKRGTVNMVGTGKIPQKTQVCELLCETLARMGRRVLFLCSCGSLMDYVIVDGSDLEDGGLACACWEVCRKGSEKGKSRH